MIPVRYLDASIPICVFIGEPASKFEVCKSIMDAINCGEERVRTNAFTVAEIFHILSRERTHPDKIVRSVSRFLDCAGLRVSDVSAENSIPALKLAMERGIDFTDAHHVLTIREHGIREIYSLDPHFDKFPGIKRLESVR